MTLYSYEGPIMLFDKIIDEKWSGKTQAVSEARARSNLLYRFKKSNNYMPNVKLTMPGKLIIVE